MSTPDSLNPATWRLKLAGEVPMKWKNLSGSFEFEKGEITFSAIIASTDLIAFVETLFPPTIRQGSIVYTPSVTLPGIPGLVAKKVSFKNQDDGKPIDPFLFDKNAPADTYHPLIEVDIEFGPRVNTNPQADDPRTFLEVSGDSTGEFIHSPAPNAKWQAESADPNNLPDSEDPGLPGLGNTNTESDDPVGKPPVAGASSPQKDPSLPMMIMVPHTEWTVKWEQIPFFYFYNVLVRRLRWCLGRVNEESMPLLHDALPETILFMGYKYTQIYTWRSGQVNVPPITIEMKFLEKRVVGSDGLIKGHNHFWRPGFGWQRLLINSGGDPAYQSRDMNVIWDLQDPIEP